jgi:hypothetical protein
LMAFISVSGDPGCHPEEVARLAAREMNCELVTEPILCGMIAKGFGDVPAKAWADAATSVLAALAAQRHIVISAIGSETLFANYPGVLRVRLTASESRRAGDIMLDRRVDRTEAKRILREMTSEFSEVRKSRVGKASAQARHFDLVLSCDTFSSEQLAALIGNAVEHKQLFEAGVLSRGAEAQIQFQVRFKLAKFGLAPSHRPQDPKRNFQHPSEEIFANLLDFYRVPWEYEPRSFPLQWGPDGRVQEAFTPDFYLPEADLYVELTAMKQTLVTRKNRKIRLLRAIYPHINIQVFYQRDLQDLVMKYGLAEKAAT